MRDMSNTRKQIAARLGMAAHPGAKAKYQKEYILWALPKGETDRLEERPIAEGIQTPKQMDEAKRKAAAAGWHGFRVQILDMSKPFRWMSRPGAKAKMARWTLDASEGWGDLSKQWTATINGTQWAIVVEGATGNGSLMRVQPGRAPQTIKRGSVEQLKRYAETLKSSRPGAKAAFGSKRTTAGALRKQLKAQGITDLADLEWHGISASDPDNTPYWLHEDGSMEKIKSSRPGAKAKMAAAPGVAELERLYAKFQESTRLFTPNKYRDAGEQKRMTSGQKKDFAFFENLLKAARSGDGKRAKALLAKTDSLLTTHFVPKELRVWAAQFAAHGAKAKMAMIPIGTMRRLKKNYDEYLAYLHRNDPKRKPMSFDEFVDEHKESVENSPMFDSNQFSRPGAKAKFAEDAREVAQEILRQLGGGRFMAMVGGKNAFHGTFGGKAGLQFDIGKGADGGVNRVIVKLDRGTDTYDMEFWRIGNRGMNVKKVSEASGVYADDLQRIFTSRTKFYTSLSRPGAKATAAKTTMAAHPENIAWMRSLPASVVNQVRSILQKPHSSARAKALRDALKAGGVGFNQFVPDASAGAEVLGHQFREAFAKTTMAAPTPHKVTIVDKTGTERSYMVSDRVLRSIEGTKKQAEARGTKPAYDDVIRLGTKMGEVMQAAKPSDLEREDVKAGLKLMAASDEAVSDKIRTLIAEGKPQDQAVAIALDMKRRGEI